MEIRNIRLTAPDDSVRAPQKSPIKVVDLSAALRLDATIPVGARRAAQPKQLPLSVADEDEPMDTELQMAELLTEILTADCVIDLSALRRRKLRNKTTKRSLIGSILCARFGNLAATRSHAYRAVKHDFGGARHVIGRYAFEKPSPDDVISGQLAKWKRP